MTGQNRYNWPDFSVRKRFLRSWVHNLMVFKKRGLVLKKWSWSWKNRWFWSCNITGFEYNLPHKARAFMRFYDITVNNTGGMHINSLRL